MIACRDAARSLERRADGLLELGGVLELEAHLSRCPRCAARAHSLSRLEELLDALPEPPIERLDLDAAVAGVMARVEPLGVARALGRQGARRRRRIWLAAAGLGLAASLALRLLVPSTGELAIDAPDTPSPTVADGVVTPPGAHAAEAVEPLRGTDAHGLVLERASQSDPARELAVRTLLRRALIAAGDPALTGAPPAWRSDFDRGLAPLAKVLAAEGWPVERMAASWLAHPDAALAGAAARFVGPRADALTLRRLERALESGADPLAAARALAEHGGEGRSRLARRALHPEHGALARAALAALEPNLAAALLLEGLRTAPTAGAGSALGALVLDLARLGPAGARALLAAGDQGLVPEGQALAALADPSGADVALAALAEPSSGAFVPLAAARLAGARALPGLLALCERRPGLAAPALAWIDDPLAPAQLARLAARGDLAAEELGMLAAGVAARHPLALAAGARALVAGRERDALEALLEALAAEPMASALPALEVLLGARGLRAELTLAAVLALGGSGLDGAAPLLAERLERCTRDERHLAAACLASLHALRGEGAVEAWLDALGFRVSPAARRAVHDALRRRASDPDASAALLRLARALEPLLPPPSPARRSEP